MYALVHTQNKLVPNSAKQDLKTLSMLNVTGCVRLFLRLQDPATMLPGCEVGGQKAKWLFSQQCLDEEEATGPTNADGNIFPCLLSLVFSVL